MPDVAEVEEEAKKLAETKDELALRTLLGLRAAAIDRDPNLSNDLYLNPQYEEHLMGPLDDVRALGARILKRWNKELYNVVCGKQPANEKERAQILNALNLGEAAVIGAVAGALLPLGVPPPLAAVLAPLIVKVFIWPAKDELCKAWAELIEGQN